MGPVPLPSFTPLTVPAALSRPFIFCELGDPDPRLTDVAWGPLPELDAFMPGMPATPRLTWETAGPVSGWRGLVGEPRRTGEGFAS